MLDLSKPLIPEFSVDGQVQSIEYECMGLLCLHCGRFGHVRKACADFLKIQKGKERAGVAEKEVANEMTVEEGEDLPMKESPWKVVQKPWRQRRNKFGAGYLRAGNRFEVLKENDGEDKRRVPLHDITNQNGGKEGNRRGLG